MKLCWINLGLCCVAQFGVALADYFNRDAKALTIIGTCMMPVLVFFLVCFMTEVKRIYDDFAGSTDDDC